MNNEEVATRILDEIAPIRREVFRTSDPELQLETLLELFPFNE